MLVLYTHRYFNLPYSCSHAPSENFTQTAELTCSQKRASLRTNSPSLCKFVLVSFEELNAQKIEILSGFSR